jgi:uncharacterized protein (TIGR03032 family)
MTTTAERIAPAAGEPFRNVASAGLAELLYDLGISLLATTYQSGRLIAIRAADRCTLNTHLREFPRPMGLAAEGGRLALGTDTAVWDFRNAPQLAPHVEPPGPHDACYVPRSMHFTGDIAIHELAFAGGELWGVNTRFSALCTFDGEHSFVPRWRPPFLTGPVGIDQCHLNGVAVVDGRVRYATAFGETTAPGGWREGKSRGGVLLDVDGGGTVLRGLSMPHSPRSHGGRFWVLESGRGTLAVADLPRGAFETVIELPGFTRGLAFAGPFAFVGLSRIREKDLFSDIPLRTRVPERECGIWVVDLRGPTVVGALRFVNEVSEIFDVQVLHGTRYPEIASAGSRIASSSYVVPEDAAFR